MITRLIVTLTLVAGLAACLLPAIAEKRLDRQVRSTLLILQEGLQKYHVAEEHYPIRFPMNGSELSQLLIETGHLETAPRNPWTGQPHGSDDSERDRIRYRTDELAETYTLEALQRDSDAIHHVIDSTEHPSLE